MSEQEIRGLVGWLTILGIAVLAWFLIGVTLSGLFGHPW